VSATGEFTVDSIPTAVLPIDLGTDGVEGIDIDPKLTGDLLNFRFATDYRFNRRDALVAFFGFTGIAKGRLGVGLDVNLEETTEVALPDGVELSLAYGGSVPLSASYTVAGAYQITFKNLEIRIGAGKSAVPGTWIVGPLDMSYRFGGKTRIQENRVKKGWKRNKKDLKEGGDAANDPSAAPPPPTAPPAPPPPPPAGE
jgi:hypothetical protein